MANQQLIDYIKQQLKLGVAKDALRATLLQAGWAEADVSEAIRGTEDKPAAAQSSPFVINRDTFESKSEPLFQMKGEVKQKPEPKTVSPQLVKIELPVRGGSRWWKLAALIFIAVSVSLAASSVFFYMANTDLVSQVATLLEDKGELGTKVSQLTQEIDDLKGQLSTFETENQTENQDVISQLEIFVTPLPLSTSTDQVSVTVKGTLGGGDKSLYWLTTNRTIVVYVKNSKDKAVDAALKPLLGSTVEISGVHLAGSRDITVTSVNGQPVQ